MTPLTTPNNMDSKLTHQYTKNMTSTKNDGIFIFSHFVQFKGIASHDHKTVNDCTYFRFLIPRVVQKLLPFTFGYCFHSVACANVQVSIMYIYTSDRYSRDR